MASNQHKIDSLIASNLVYKGFQVLRDNYLVRKI